jgi:hypothetical protein
VGLGEGGGGIGHEHVAAAAEHAVDRVVVEVEVFGVHDPVVDVVEVEVEGGGAASGDVDHGGREVG